VFERHHAKQRAEAYQRALATWQSDRDGLAAALAMAGSFEGERQAEGFVLQRGEGLFATVTGVGLVEERRVGGHWQSGTSGLSVPVGSLGGRTVRYHVGATRGHYVQGAPTPTAIDTGTVRVTDRRLVFTGSAQTRECRFDKLLGYHLDPGRVTVSVSNRQKPTTIDYGAALDDWFGFRLELALAHHQGQVPELVAQLNEQMGQLDARRPVPPPPPPG